jgi:hypothetical protein
MKFYFIIIACFVCIGFATAQTYLPFQQIKSYTAVQKPNHLDSTLTTLTNRLGIEIHYLYPLYQAIGWEDKFKKSMGEVGYDDNFSQLLSFVGDNAMADRYAEKNYAHMSDSAIRMVQSHVAELKDIKYAPAKASIISNADFYRVIMINEAHNKPLHRAFTYSLLDELYQKGFRYLAMEAFNNYANKSLDSLNVFTGYYTNEPVAGELVRKALRLGFKLVSYEDTLAFSHSPSQRDSVQAANLYAVIKSDPSAKILVHAGYGHVSEEKIGDYIPMARWFEKISGLETFTIDQTDMTEGSNFEYGKWFYHYFTTKYAITTPSVIFQDKRPFNPLNEKGVDLIIVHPPVIYDQNRPTWLSLNGDRQQVLIQPTEKNLFLAQAYYANEYHPEDISALVPADQTYIANKEGYYCLYLRKGNYKIVLRDVGYKVLSTKDLEVK